MLELSLVPIDGVHSHEVCLDVKSGMGNEYLRVGVDVNFGTHPQ